MTSFVCPYRRFRLGRFACAFSRINAIELGKASRLGESDGGIDTAFGLGPNPADAAGASAAGTAGAAGVAGGATDDSADASAKGGASGGVSESKDDGKGRKKQMKPARPVRHASENDLSGSLKR